MTLYLRDAWPAGTSPASYAPTQRERFGCFLGGTGTTHLARNVRLGGLPPFGPELMGVADISKLDLVIVLNRVYQKDVRDPETIKRWSIVPGDPSQTLPTSY